MTGKATAFLGLMMAVAMTACSSAGPDVDYTRDRAISTDISASLNRGPSAAQPGIAAPIGIPPGPLDERAPPGQ